MAVGMPTGLELWEITHEGSGQSAKGFEAEGQ
jgi:hypothetical protein